MVKVKKRDGKYERFSKSKIAAGIRSAGATAEEAAHVAEEVAGKVVHKAEVTAQKLSGMVVTSLRKVNKAAADEFVRFRDKKLRAKRKKGKGK